MYMNLIVIRPFCLVKSCMLDAAAMRARSLFSLFTFCNIIFSCSLISKERIYLVPFTCGSLMEIPATINLYYNVIWITRLSKNLLWRFGEQFNDGFLASCRLVHHVDPDVFDAVSFDDEKIVAIVFNCNNKVGYGRKWMVKILNGIQNRNFYSDFALS